MQENKIKLKLGRNSWLSRQSTGSKNNNEILALRFCNLFTLTNYANRASLNLISLRVVLLFLLLLIKVNKFPFYGVKIN